MFCKKKKYNCRFPPARIKKIMQLDEEVGKVAAVVPLIISRALELFVETFLTESSEITRSRNARTLTPSHLKCCIASNSQFFFLKEIVSTIPDIQPTGEEEQSEVASNISSLGSSKSTNKPIRLTNCNPQSSATTKGRGRPRKGLNSPSKNQVDDEEDDNDEDEYETLDEEEEEEGNFCDNSSLSLPKKTQNNTPSMTNQLNSFGFALSQQTEDDDYDA